MIKINSENSPVVVFIDYWIVMGEATLVLTFIVVQV